MGKRSHVTRLGVDHEPPLLEAKVAAGDPAHLAHKRVRTVSPDHPSGADCAALTGLRELPGFLLTHPVKVQLGMVARVHQPVRHPASLHRHPRRDARVTMDRCFQFGLEEHVVRLPARSPQTVHVEPQQQLAVGAEPLVVADRNHLLGQHVGQVKRLEQAHDLVIEMYCTGHAVDLLKPLEHHHSMPSAAQHRRQCLPHRPVADDRHVSVKTGSSHDETPEPAGTGRAATGRARIWLNAPASSPSGSSAAVGPRHATNRSGRTRIAPSLWISRWRNHAQRGS